jgi:hypothetical protein
LCGNPNTAPLCKTNAQLDPTKVCCVCKGSVCASYAGATRCDAQRQTCVDGRRCTMTTCQAGQCDQIADGCGCTPAATCPASQNCGTAPNGCDGTIPCDTCADPDTCGDGDTPGVCEGSETCVAFAHRTNAGPPTQEEFTVQRATGIQSIVVTKRNPVADNADVPIPPFTTGTTDPMIITVTKINQPLSSTVSFSVTHLSRTV